MTDRPPTALTEIREQAGEIELDAPTDVLAQLLQSVRDRRKVLGDMEKALTHEITGRMKTAHRSVLTAGTLELRLEHRNESQWDVDELETVLRELIDEGVIEARDAVGVIKHEVTVSRSNANRFLGLLLGSARQRVEACRHWQKSATARLEVTTAVQLIEPLEAEATAIEDAP